MRSSSEAERARRAIFVGLVLFRWGALAWMVALALTTAGYARPAVAWAGLGAAGAWTLWTSVPRRAPVVSLWLESLIAVVLIVLSGVVIERRQIGARSFYATAWPIASVIAWAVARGPVAGTGAALALAGALVGSRVTNGFSIADLPSTQVQSLANGAITFVLAGLTVGIVSRALDRSAEEAERLTSETLRANERAARLAERETIARQIHDSVLQTLALVRRRARELSTRTDPSRDELDELARMTGKQEEELRALILREPEEPPTGRASLRDALEQAARAIDEVPVVVSSVGPVWLPAHDASELAAAATQALQNVVRHARATRASVFAECSDGVVVVTVRDDGVGFRYDEEDLRAHGKAGILKSIKGRVEALGGSVTVATEPGRGTEIEMRIPERA